jgi:alpha-D-ribose 1-methylphosphonate 5-phosphate C-P lyase
MSGDDSRPARIGARTDKPQTIIEPHVGDGPSLPHRLGQVGATSTGYNFAYLDEQSKRMIRRAILKAIAIPGYQVPFASREMPMPYGWGTGGVQVTAAIIGPDDVLKVIDQGADDTTNAVSIRRFFARTAGVATTTATADATIIQTRHRVPEAALKANQVLVYQVPIPEPLRFLEPRETETRKLHALADYGLMHVKLYEDIARHGHIATTYAYPVEVAGRYVMDPSPTPKFDNPKLDDCEALQLFGAGREKRIYAVPPHTRVKSLDFEDHPFTVQRFTHPCALCAAEGVYLDEVVLDDRGGRMFVCSDTDYCETRRAAGHRGEMLGTAPEALALGSRPSSSDSSSLAEDKSQNLDEDVRPAGRATK